VQREAHRKEKLLNLPVERLLEGREIERQLRVSDRPLSWLMSHW
jgi:hypothetical protein